MSDTGDETKKILEDEMPSPSGKELKHLIAELKSDFEFGLARELLAKARDADPADVWIVQQLALCTFADIRRLIYQTRETEAPLGPEIGVQMQPEIF
jgi:hypothetical protein